MNKPLTRWTAQAIKDERMKAARAAYARLKSYRLAGLEVGVSRARLHQLLTGYDPKKKTPHP